MMKIEPQAHYWEELAPPRRYDAYVFARVPKRALNALRTAGRLERASRGRPLLRVEFEEGPFAKAMESEVIGALANSASIFAVRERALEAAFVLKGEAATSQNRSIELRYSLRHRDGRIVVNRSFRGERENFFELQDRLIQDLTKDLAKLQAVARRSR